MRPGMIAETGHFALWLAAALALAQLVGGGVLLRGGDDARALRLLVPAAWAQGVLCTFAFGALIWTFAVSDFSVELVARHSHTDKPALYKLTGAWANHEGSMLLWVTVLAIFGAVAAWRVTAMGPRFRARVPERDRDPRRRLAQRDVADRQRELLPPRVRVGSHEP